ncbi:MAG: HEAT repeat domain-containing protein [Acidobacteriota bacterium]|nr:HEAT repeat domain-containing protein [Acidobacteriota bacterium]
MALCAGALAQTPREVRAIAKDGSSAIPELTDFLKNSDAGIRNEAVKGLIEIGGVRSLDPLIAATRDNDDQIQIRAVDGLVNFYVPGYVPSGMTANLKRAGSSIKQRFGDRNDQVIDPYVTVRPEVIQAIGHVLLGGSSTESRANAARAIGILRGRAALPDLYEVLRSRKDTDVLYESIVAIQKIRDEQAGPKVQYLLRDLNERVQIAAIETAGILQNRAALPDLRNVLNSSNKARVRRAALAAIAMLPDPSNRDLYSGLLHDKDEALRTAAAEGFGRLRNAGDVAMLQTAYDAETKRAPQLALAFAMVMDGRTESTEQSPLKFLIQNLGNSGSRGTAQAYLTEAARDPGVRLQLYGPMERGSKEEKIGLAQVLAGTGDHGAESHLESISRDKDRQVAQEGLRALRNLRAGK